MDENSEKTKSPPKEQQNAPSTPEKQKIRIKTDITKEEGASKVYVFSPTKDVEKKKKVETKIDFGLKDSSKLDFEKNKVCKQLKKKTRVEVPTFVADFDFKPITKDEKVADVSSSNADPFDVKTEPVNFTEEEKKKNEEALKMFNIEKEKLEKKRKLKRKLRNVEN